MDILWPSFRRIPPSGGRGPSRERARIYCVKRLLELLELDLNRVFTGSVIGEVDTVSGMAMTYLPQLISFPMEPFPGAAGRLHPNR